MALSQNPLDSAEEPTRGKVDRIQRKSVKKASGGFQSLDLSEPVYHGIVKMGFRVPTPVQRKALPVCLSGVDSVVMARTGSGKTAAFVIPVLERLVQANEIANGPIAAANRSVKAIILSPTRELCLQTLKVTNTLGKFCTDITATGIVGGDSIVSQFAALAKRPQIIVATPGRLSHLLREVPDFDLKQCDMVVFDEADRLFEMGFKEQLREICSSMPDGRQTMLFSATMPKSLVEFTRSGALMSSDATVVRLDSEATVSDELRVGFITCRSEEKDAALLTLMRNILRLEDASKGAKADDTKRNAVESTLSKTNAARKGAGSLTLVFAATRHHVEYLSTLLQLNYISSTSIYGAMDHEARKQAIASFRTGSVSVLIVTDVAARGIDIPLIDFVVHHSFPSSPKLFVHRSGRAARAGRIGYCFALVEPDEMPYMVDLHLFLGRPLASAANVSGEYTLSDMTPNMVHYGSIPESIMSEESENVHRLMNAKESGGFDAELLWSQRRVCANAMKQYRKTRPQASGHGVRRAKSVLQRSGPSPSHPLLRSLEMARFSAARWGEDHLENLRKRDEFLSEMAAFRPKETVFEAFVNSSSKAGSSSTQMDKGCMANVSSTKSSNALDVMKAMRRQMRLARNKEETLVVAGSSVAHLINDYDEVNVSERVKALGDTKDKSIKETGETELEVELCPPPCVPKMADESVSGAPMRKRPLSKAERKRRKKSKNDDKKIDEVSFFNESRRTKSMQGVDFRDNVNFIDVEQGFDARQREREASMQPSASCGIDSRANAARLEQAMLDIVGDENADMVKRHRVMRWDKSKKKYIQTSLGAEINGMSKSKRVKLESGQIVRDNKAKVGDLYEKWQKTTNQSIGRYGAFDEASGRLGATTDRAVSSIGRGLVGRDHIEETSNRKKSVAQIQKERKGKTDMKLKNMKKKDRKKVEGRIRANKAREPAKMARKAHLGNKGGSGRWSRSK